VVYKKIVKLIHMKGRFSPNFWRDSTTLYDEQIEFGIQKLHFWVNYPFKSSTTDTEYWRYDSALITVINYIFNVLYILIENYFTVFLYFFYQINVDVVNVRTILL